MKRVLLLMAVLVVLLCGCDNSGNVDISIPPSDDINSVEPVSPEPSPAQRPSLSPVQNPNEGSDIPSIGRPSVSVGTKPIRPVEPGGDLEEYTKDIFGELGYTEDQIRNEDYRSLVYLDYGSGVSAYLEIEQFPSNPQKVCFFYECATGVKASDYTAIAEDVNTLLGTKLTRDDISLVVDGVVHFTYGMGEEFVYLNADVTTFTAYILV